jgi:hypothetical protein
VKPEADTDYDRSLDDEESREGDDSLNDDRMLGRFLDMLIRAQSRTAWKSPMPGLSLYDSAH